MFSSLSKLLKKSKNAVNQEGTPKDSINTKLSMPPKDSRERARQLVIDLQDEICSGLEKVDGEGK